MNSVLIFGDSISLGAWDSRGGWATRLKQELYTRTVQTKGFEEFELSNLSIDGNSSEDILRRLRSDIDSRYSSRRPFVIVFSYGVNDQRVKNNKPETSISDFKKNTGEIIKISKEYTDKLIFTGLTPLAKSEFEQFGYSWDDHRIEMYDESLQEVVEKAGLKFLNLRNEFERVGTNKLISYDDLHPNDAGHQLIYEIVDREIQEYLK